MRPLLVPVSVVAALLVGAPVHARNDVLVRQESSTPTLAGVRTVSLDVPVGDVHVDAGGAGAEARLELRCDEDSTRCAERATRIHLVTTQQGDRLLLRVAGWGQEENHGIHRPDVDLHVTLPVALAVRVEMGVGDLDLRGVEGDVAVHVGVGDAKVDVPASAVHVVDADSGVGDARLYPPAEDSEHHGFFHLGNEASWHAGQGRSTVRVHVGVGDAHVRMTPAVR
jgi:hypothetical protein